MKPLLAVNADLNKLKFPLYASPKLDGIRTLILDGKTVTRNLKPIPNRYIREKLEAAADILNNFDGELIVGSPTASNCFNVTSSAVMSYEGEPEFTYHVFDRVTNGTYKSRWIGYRPILPAFCKYVPQVFVEHIGQVNELEEVAVSKGYEGIMLRSPDGGYKFGRSTVNEGILLKLKRFEDFEAEIIGFEERLHNANEATKDALGHTERSSHKANMIPMGTLGSLICKSPLFPEPFNVGTGFDDDYRQEIWDMQHKFLGKMAKIKHQPSGAKDLPRFPVFLGIRNASDI